MPSNIFKLGLKLWSSDTLYLSDAIKFYKEGLYNFIELYIVPGSYPNLTSLRERLSVPFIIHCPHESHDFNLADKSKEKYNIKVFEEVIKYADDLKAKNIVIHSGSNGSIKEACRQLKHLNDSRLTIENSVSVGSTIEEIKLLLNRNKVKFCLDISHAICTANNLKKDPLIYLNEFNNLSPALYHLTGGNIKSKIDKHNHFSDSNYPWEKILPIIKKGSRITIETDRDEEDSLSDFKDDIIFLRSLFVKTLIVLRKAKNEDSPFLYDLRNDPLVKTKAFNQGHISLTTHKNWFQKKINDSNTLILIAENKKNKIGQVRFDIDNEKKFAEIDIAIVKKYRGFGYGPKILDSACKHAFKNLKINKIFAFIKENNVASLKSFSKAGFINREVVNYKLHNCIKMTLMRK